MSAAPFLTSIPDREPRRKAHEHLRDARKAVTVRIHRGVLDVPVHVYQWSDAEGWVLLWKLLAGTPEEDLPWNQHKEQPFRAVKSQSVDLS
jgi:hypothetical protein